MGLESGILRYRIIIEKRIDRQDPVYGGITPQWVKLYSNVPAGIQPISAREFMAADAKQSMVIARITIRYKMDITASCRIKHGTKIYNVEGVLANMDEGLTYLVLPCSEGVNEG